MPHTETRKQAIGSGQRRRQKRIQEQLELSRKQKTLEQALKK